MLTVQCAKAANVLPQVVADCAKSPGSVPVNVNGAPENVNVVVRLFFTLITFVALVCPTVIQPKDSAAGVIATCTTPVPERAICCGLLLAASVITRVADLAPSAPGVNVTLTVHDLFAASVLVQVVAVFVKSPALVPVIAIELMLTVPPALLVRVNFLTTLVVPIA